MKYIIDTDKMTVTPYTEEPEKLTLADMFRPHRGVKEYDGIVADIQKWFYGSLVRASWCATAVSYFADQLGIADQIGKHENVKQMMDFCKDNGRGRFFTKSHIPDKILKGDVLFFLWDDTGAMTTTSSKHVTVAEYDSTGGNIFCIGGNQKDKICTLEYSRAQLYAVYRPEY